MEYTGIDENTALKTVTISRKQVEAQKRSLENEMARLQTEIAELNEILELMK